MRDTSRNNDVIQAYLDGETTLETREHLKALLKDDPEFAIEFVFRVKQESLMYSTMKTVDLAGTEAATEERARPIRFPIRSRWVAAAAAVLLLYLGLSVGRRVWQVGLRPAGTAMLAHSEGRVIVITADGTTFGEPGIWIPPGATVQVAAEGSRASLSYPDGTKLTLADNARIILESRQLVDKSHTPLGDRPGKDVEILRGTVTAEIAPQPHAMLFATPHAVVEVLGTGLELRVDETETRLDVTTGSVRIRSHYDQSSLDLAAGEAALARAAVSVARLPSGTESQQQWQRRIIEDFAAPVVVGRRWEWASQGFPAECSAGHFQIDLSPRPASMYRSPVNWGLEDCSIVTTEAFALPLRVTVDVTVPRHRNLLAAIKFLPKGRKHWQTGLALLYRREDRFEYRVMPSTNEGDPIEPTIARVGSNWPATERWELEFSATGIRVRLNGEQVASMPHLGDVPVFETYHVAVCGNAKRDVPVGSYVRFDNFILETKNNANAGTERR